MINQQVIDLESHVADLDDVEKLLEFSDSDKPECFSSKFGCCPDGKTPG